MFKIIKNKIALLLILVSLSLVSCTQNDKSLRILEDAGYKNITITGYRMWGCGEDDQFSTGFKAIGTTGRKVSGVVCGGFFKNSTIRLD